MSQILYRPNLATLAEALFVLREELRRYVTSEFLNDDVVLNVVRNSLPDHALYQIGQVLWISEGKGDVLDLVDFSVVCKFKSHIQEGDVSDRVFSTLRDISPSLKKIVEYRNKVCHPPLRDVSSNYLEKALKRTLNLLGRIGSPYELQRSVQSLLDNPISQSHFLDCLEARECKGLRIVVKDLKETVERVQSELALYETRTYELITELKKTEQELTLLKNP